MKRSWHRRGLATCLLVLVTGCSPSGSGSSIDPGWAIAPASAPTQAGIGGTGLVGVQQGSLLPGVSSASNAPSPSTGAASAPSQPTTATVPSSGVTVPVFDHVMVV